MGQYHRVVNVDRMEALSPHPLGNGFKLMEFGCSGYGVMAALGLFLLGEGRWSGCHIGIVGDYHEPGDVPDALRAQGVEAADLWVTRQELAAHPGAAAAGRCSPDPGHHPLDVSGDAAAELVAAGMWTSLPDQPGWVDAPVDPDYRARIAPDSWVVNLDRGEALDPEDLGDSPNPYSFVADFGGGTMTVLAVLLAASNGRGGGDVQSSDPLVGSWAFDRLGIVPRPATGGPFRVVSPRARAVLDAADEATYLLGDGRVRRVAWSGGTKEPEGLGDPVPPAPAR